MSTKKLLRLLSPLFWEKRLTRDDIEKYSLWVIKRVLMLGTWEQVHALRQHFDDEQLLEAVASRGIDSRTRNYWNTMLIPTGKK